MNGLLGQSMTGAKDSAGVSSGTNRSSSTSSANQIGFSSALASNVPNKAVNTGQTNLQTNTSLVNVSHKPGTFIMSRPAAPNGNPVPLQPGMQLVNVRPNLQMTATRGIPSRMLVNQIQGVRPGQGQVTALQTLQNISGSGQGHLIVKTDNGQIQLLRLNTQPQQSGQIASNGTAPPGAVVVQSNNAFRYQQPQNPNNIVTLANNTSIASHATTTGTIVVPASALSGSQPSLVTQSVAATLQHSATSPAVGTVRYGQNLNIRQLVLPNNNQTITADSAKSKCKNFLSTLLRLASEQRAKVSQNVQTLIQGLIDGKVEPEVFTEELQKDLNSSPQPCLVPFLKKTLPYLRSSLARGEIEIDGVKAPPLSTVQPVPGMTTVIPSMVGLMRSNATGATTNQNMNPVRLYNSQAAGGTVGQRPAVAPSTPVTPSANARYVNLQQVRMGKPLAQQPIKTLSAANVHTNSISGTANSVSGGPGIVKTISRISARDDRKAKDKNTAFNFSTSNVADDDINDVAAMGGVNLGEESQRILDSTGFVGTQIRSCRDDTFLNPNILANKIRQMCADQGLDEPSKEVVALISHATQERLKTIVEKLGTIAEHRLDIIKNEPRYELCGDTKGQIRFLEELDKMEKKKKDEHEREILLRAAKSRSKTEDPEQVKLKAKAKEMQRVEMEEMLKKDANLTALNALQGPRSKRPRPDGDEVGGTFSGTFTQKKMALRPRVKRVSVRDMQFLMEQDKELSKGSMLYKYHLK